MSTLIIGGRPWTAGLAWRPRSHRASEVRTARRFDCPFLVHSRHQTGFADPDDAEGQVALAAALAEHLGESEWIAALQDDDGSAVAVVRFENGEFPPNGDEVYPDRNSARDAIARSRQPGVALYAMPVLAIEDARVIDAGLIGTSEAMQLEPVPATSRMARALKMAAAASFLVFMCLAGWLHWEDIFQFIDGEDEVVAAPLPPAEVKVAIAGAALIETCDRALKTMPADVPAWQIARIECTASLQDPGILDEWPQFRNRPALVVRWSLQAGHDPEISRRLMEDHVTRMWQLSSVIGTTAWSLMELEPVLAEWNDNALPAFLVLREAIDRAAGPWATSLAYQQIPSQPWTVVLTGPAPLSHAHAALSGIEGLEITRLVRTAGSEWRIDGREVTPRVFLEEVFRTITAPLFNITNEESQGHV